MYIYETGEEKAGESNFSLLALIHRNFDREFIERVIYFSLPPDKLEVRKLRGKWESMSDSVSTLVCI